MPIENISKVEKIQKMNILVCISSVPDTTSKINFSPDGKSFDKTGIQFVINPHDEYSLSKALQLKEKNGAQISVLSVGDASCEPVLRKALAMGADVAMRVDTEPNDSLATAQEIARVVKEQNFDLILAGKESIDYNGGVVPATVAALLEIPFANNCVGLEVQGNEAIAVVENDDEVQHLKLQLPAVIAGQNGIVAENELKIPNMRGIMQARSKKLEVIAPSETTSNLKVEQFTKPASRGAVKMIDANAIDELVELLRKDTKLF